MTDSRYTRCPGCATVFRVTQAQLELREGQVRCGHCRAVFDAHEHVVSLDAGPPSDEFDAMDELALGRPTVTLRSADALQPVPRPVVTRSADAMHPVVPPPGIADEGTAREGTIAEAGTVEGTAGEAAALAGTAGERTDDVAAVKEVASAVAAARPTRSDWKQWKQGARSDASPKRIYVIAIAVLAAALVVQAALEYRSALAAHVPAARPLLAGACAVLGCTIDPMRDSAALSIDASDLQADPAHRGLLLLTATIRNRASHAIAYPYLELTLTDASDDVVVRRAFSPADYLGNADPAPGLPPNGERLVRVFIDASATQQAGYRLYLFYP